MDSYAIAKDPEHLALDRADILLSDMVAVVTGGGGGIGQGISLGLARFGARVAVLDIEPERAERTATLIVEGGGDAIGVVVDVMDSDRLRTAVEQAVDRFDRLDILVNNAGGVRGRRFADTSDRSIRRHVEINLMSMFIATSAAIPPMIAGGRGGSILNVSSIEAFRAAPMFSVYAACKAGMVNFTKTMAVELGEHGIRVNGIAPDHTITPGNMGNRTGPVDPSSWIEPPQESLDAMRRLIPLGREGVVEECAAAAVFLSSRMAAYVTGATLSVDGGTRAASGWLRTDDGGWTLSPGWHSLS